MAHNQWFPTGTSWGRYRGPDVDSIGSAGPTVDLSYLPEDDGISLRCTVGHRTSRGRATRCEKINRLIGPYEGAKCIDDCLEVELGVDSPAGLLRIPVATGYVLDPESVRLDDQPLTVLAVATGQPALRLETPRVGRLRYRSGLGGSGKSAAPGAWPALPPDVAEFARELEVLPVSFRAFEATEFVRQRVSYDTSTETAARHAEARRQSIGLFERAITIGAGDCDVQNSLIVAILEASGVRSRLAVGWIGTGGQVRTGSPRLGGIPGYGRELAGR